MSKTTDASLPICYGHTPCPTGYSAWQRWAEEMQKTHKQMRCPSCGLYAVWVPIADPLAAETRAFLDRSDLG